MIIRYLDLTSIPLLQGPRTRGFSHQASVCIHVYSVYIYIYIQGREYLKLHLLMGPNIDMVQFMCKERIQIAQALSYMLGDAYE